MRTRVLAWLSLIAAGGAWAGWLARGAVERSRCDYTAAGYPLLRGDIRRLPSLPLERVVSSAALGEIQKCWAANPYAGPQHSLELVDARLARDGGYYVIFEPDGINDVGVVFLVLSTLR